MVNSDTINCRGSVSQKLVVFLAFILLFGAGVAYRVLASRLEIVDESSARLPVSLSSFPMRVGNWRGKDVPIPETVQEVAGNDDFLNRVYVNKAANKWANIYIAYTSSPRTMLGHRPDKCYVGAGWVHDSTAESHFVSEGGRKIPCLIHRFHMPAPSSDSIVVLNYYILNGQITVDHSGFSGVSFRNPEIGGDLAKYVAQVQIASMLENSTRALAHDVADRIIRYFPDANGVVEIADEKAGASD